MTPEEAQALSESKWERLAQGGREEDLGSLWCGWCEWVESARPEWSGRGVTELMCNCPPGCPVIHVLGVSCLGHKKYQEWLWPAHGTAEGKMESAQEIYDLVVENGPALIAVAYRMQEEVL